MRKLTFLIYNTRNPVAYLLVFCFLWFFTVCPAAAQEASFKFSDVPEKTFLWPYTAYLASKNIIKGFPDGTFRPAGNVTRAQAAKMLVQAAGLKESPPLQQPFKDVAKSYWAGSFIEAAAVAGLLKGYPDGTFKPEKPLTRAENICLLLRLTKKPLPQVDLPDLKDIKVNHWAAYQVSAALDTGIVDLAGEKIFAPDKSCTRGEMARGLALMMTLSPELRKTFLEPMLVAKKGKVTVLSPDSLTPQVVNTGYKLRVGEVIQVGEDGSAEIIFKDGSGLKIEADTELEVAKLEGAAFLSRDGTAKSSLEYLEINLKKGKIFGALASPHTVAKKEEQKSEKAALESNKNLPVLFSGHQPQLSLQSAVFKYSQKSQINLAASLPTKVQPEKELPWWKAATAKRTKVKVNMPWGVAGIRGSFWMNQVIPNAKEIVNVLLGEAEVTCGDLTVIMKDGSSTQITGAGLSPSIPSPMTKEEWKAWLAVKDWLLKRAQEIQQQFEQNLSLDPKTILDLEKRLEPYLPLEVIKVVTEALTRAESQAGKDESSPGGGGGSGYATPVLTFQPALKRVALGEEFEVSMLVQNIQDLYGIDVQFKYDPEKLEVITAETGDEWKETKGFAKVKSESGKLSLVMTRKASNPGCYGTVVLSTIRFKALSAGKADLEYTFHELASSVPNWLTHQIEKGVVEIAD